MRRLLAPAALVAAASLLIVSAPSIAVAATAGGSTSETAEVDGASVDRSLVVADDVTIASVTIAIDFLKTEGACAAPTSGAAAHAETGFALQSPSGTTVQLVAPGTYSGDAAMARSVVVLDDAAAAAASGTPTVGAVRPSEALAAFAGESSAGEWTLTATDAAVGAPLCLLGASITIQEAGPALAGGPLPVARLGAVYAASIVADGVAPIAYAAVDPAALPPGIVLAEDGTLAGTPTQDGDFRFDVVASDATGDSEPATFRLSVQTPPTIEGAPTAIAQIGVPFSYVPTVDPGTPQSLFGVYGLPGGLAVNPLNGEIFGTPTGALGDFVGTYAPVYGVGPDPEHTVVISVVAGPTSSYVLTSDVDRIRVGGTVTFSVAGTDAEGNPTDVAATTTLVSSVAGDVVDGLAVTFTSASPHTITATDSASGLTDVAVVEVVEATVPPTTAPGGASGTLPETGGEPGWLLALAALALIGTGVAVASRSVA